MAEVASFLRILFRSPARSIGTKVFVVFFLFVVLSVAAVGAFSFSTSKSAIVELARSSSEQTIKLAGEKLDMKQQFYANLLNQLVNNSSFTENLFQISNESLGAEELIRRTEEIRGLLDQLSLSDSRIRDITLYPLEDAIGPISTVREGVIDHRDAQWMKDIREADTQALWLPVEEKGYLGNSQMPLFAYGKLLGPKNIGSKEFVLLVQIEASVLKELVEGVKLSEGAETALIDSQGQRIISNLSNYSIPSILLENKESLMGNEIRDNAKGQRDLVVYKNSEISTWTLVGIAPLNKLTESTSKIRTLTYTAVIVCIPFALLIGFWMVLLISKPLSRLLALMKQAASGDLKGRMEHQRKDEMGEVARAYNQMMEQLGQLVSETRQTVEEVAESSHLMALAAQKTVAAADETHLAMKQIAIGVNGLALNAEEGSERVEDMDAQLSTAYELQEKTTVSARVVSSTCHEGVNSVGGLIQKTAETEKHFRKVGNQVNGLEKNASSIHELLKLMTQMAKQTKILSLNASIEASRSGLAGAGFKVIAEEIRRLAEQSNFSIAHVGDLTESIQSEVNATVSAMAQAMPFFQELIMEVHAVDRLFNSVTEQMELLMTRSGKVTSSLRHIDETQVMLMKSMSEVSAVTQQSSAASDQVTLLCSEQLLIGEKLVELSAAMKGVSMKLELQMSRFQV